MAKDPAVVIIARHGARLDASDKTWHLTSPAPYDPPLTYGGWTQSRALGLRIASLLHDREKESGYTAETNGADPGIEHPDSNSPNGPKQPKPPSRHPRRKQKIIVHSSPYLRCVQTSIGISAGIAQFQPESDHSTKLGPAHAWKEKQALYGRSPSPRARSIERRAVATSAPSESSDEPHLQVFRRSIRTPSPRKTTLRIDAFLGEWLSPDYFDNITPPPNSTMMVAGAKADLLRRGEYIETQQNPNNSKGHFPGGWVRGNGLHSAGNRPGSRDGPLTGMGSLAQVLPLRERSSSHGNVAHRHHRSLHGNGTATKPSNIYDPPVPTYAVSPSDPIPRGYVMHARDACTDIDYQWDSMRPPQEWGDGGEYGDEWSAMHKRFRRGLAGMISWYREHGHEESQDNTHEAVTSAEEEKEDGEEELVLVLITHGAGCNALLGAISNQPVLLDVGMASLSMAVKKEGPPRKLPSPPLLDMRRSSMMDMGISEEYEMKMIASLDHLRPGIDPSKLPQPSSPAVSASPSLEYRRRLGSSSISSPSEPFSIGEPYRGLNSSLGSMRRGSTSSTSSKLFSSANASVTNTATASPSLGLWAARKPSVADSDISSNPGRDMAPNVSVAAPRKASNPESSPSATENDEVGPLPLRVNRSMSQHGLWGAVPTGAQNPRERGPKRRWTVSEQDA